MKNIVRNVVKGVSKLGKAAVGWLGGPVPGAIGTGLELLGGIKSATGSGGSTPYTQSYDQLMGAFAAADKAGLHRLTVAGSPAGYSPAPMAEAQGLLDAGAALRSRPSKKETELIDAQIEEARSRTALNNANTRRSLLGPQPGLGGFTPRLRDSLDRAQDGGDRGYRVEPTPDLGARQGVTLGDYTAWGPNPEPFEVGLSELLVGGLIYGPQWMYKFLKDESATPRPRSDREYWRSRGRQEEEQRRK